MVYEPSDPPGESYRTDGHRAMAGPALMEVLDGVDAVAHSPDRWSTQHLGNRDARHAWADIAAADPWRSARRSDPEQDWLPIGDD
jgi:hypothetical protein